MQRHHILPQELMVRACFSRFIDVLGCHSLGYDDFQLNGLLLPSCERGSIAFGLPLHRGPHRAYNEVVMERFGQLEERWSLQRLRTPELAVDEALMRLGLLQGGLRRSLLSGQRQPYLLNKNDPLGSGMDFSELDAMADSLWGKTQSRQHSRFH